MFEFDYTHFDPTSPVFLIQLLWFFLSNGGVLLLIPLFLWGVFRVYMNIIQTAFVKNTPYVLLAIDIPGNAIPSIREAEHVFAHFTGMHRNPNWADRYVRGYVQPKVSLEIVIIGGEVQFIIRCAKMFRDLVEAAIYAQYPDAEITEIEDYAKEATLRFPNKDYNLWGTDVIPAVDQALPIRTNEDFEDKILGKYADPLKSLLETLSLLPDGEQVWIQINLLPIDQAGWRHRSEEYAKKLAGIAIKHPETLISKFFDLIASFIEGFFQTILGAEAAESHHDKSEGQYSLMMHLTPGEKEVIELIQKKAERVGFNTTIRFVYMAPKKTFNKGLGVSAVMGYFNQFTGVNGLKPESATKTQTDYFFKNMRMAWMQNRILRYYKKREVITITGLGNVMNSAEIASLFHFPNTEEERIPSNVARSEGRKAEAPQELPLEGYEAVLEREGRESGQETSSAISEEPPQNLPIIE